MVLQILDVPNTNPEPLYIVPTPILVRHPCLSFFLHACVDAQKFDALCMLNSKRADMERRVPGVWSCSGKAASHNKRRR